MKAVISIAGFDPSGGAGVLGDIKTFENIGVTGFAAATCLTYQNESTFEGVEWIDLKKIFQQIEVVSRNHEIEFAKIGLIKSLSDLNDIIDYLQLLNQNIKIVWDPIMKASAGFEFHSIPEQKEIEKSLQKIYLMTPNWEEIKYFGFEEIEAARYLSQSCNVLLKGGHRIDEKGTDLLFSKGKERSFLPASSSFISPKHGSGCVLSSAICAYLSLGYSLETSIEKGKAYTENFLSSSDSLLGKHHLKEIIA